MATVKGKDIIETFARDHDPATGSFQDGYFAERPGDSGKVKVAKRIGRRALLVEHTGRVYPVHHRENAKISQAAEVAAAVINRASDIFETKAKERGRKGKTITPQRQLLWMVLAGARAVAKEKPYGSRSVVGTAVSQLRKGAFRELGDATKATAVRDKGREFVNTHQGDGVVRRFGQAAMRTAIMAPTIPSRVAWGLADFLHGRGRVGYQVSKSRENLGTHRKRSLIGHFAASTVILYTGMQAYSAVRYGTDFHVPDLTSPTEIMGATADTWGNVPEVISEADDIREAASQLWEDIQTPNGHKKYRDWP